MFFCPYVLMFTALAANTRYDLYSFVLLFTALAAARAHLGNKNKRACFVLHSVCTIFAQVSYKVSTMN